MYIQSKAIVIWRLALILTVTLALTLVLPLGQGGPTATNLAVAQEIDETNRGLIETLPDRKNIHKIAVVDFDLVLRSSAASRDLRERIDSLRLDFEKSLQLERDNLRAEERALTELGSQADQARRQAFDRQVDALQRHMQQANRAIESAYAMAVSQIRDSLIAAIADIARDKEYDLILRRSQAIIFRQSIDETDTALALLDLRLNTVELEIDLNALQTLSLQ